MLSLFKGKKEEEINLDDVKVVTDLDRLIEEKVGFKWHGKTHVIKPISTELFLKITNENGKLEALRNIEGVDQKMVLDAYARIFGAVCDTITIHDVREMTYMQIANLFRLIVECVTGKTYEDAEKKRQEMTQTEKISPALI